MEPQVLGPYRIVGTLGRGGMGKVYRGVHVETNEPAALKVLPAALSADRDFRRRFETEIQTLKRLRHPNIVQLFGFGEQEGVLFYAMELVEGLSLEEELARGRRFDWQEVAQIAIQTCRALRHAHDRGIIHRDIKPANLLLTGDQQVKLSDFGIARLFGHTRLTTAGNVLGTVEYMAPEQADAKPVSPRTDLYSLGGVMYTLLAGRPPFRADSIPEMLEKHRHAKPEPLRRYNMDVPAELEQIVQQLMAKSPEDRIPNAAVLSRRLEAMLHGLGAPREPLPLDTDSMPTAEMPLRPSGEPPQQEVLPPTKELTRPGEAPAAASEPESEGADPLAETKETAAFEIYAVRQQEPPRVEAGEQVRRPTGRFVPVPEEELDRVEPERPPRQPWISLQTLALGAALIAVGLAVWYLLQPPSADELYQRIVEVTREGTVASYREAEADINRFLELYSTDSRCEVLREYLTEIDLDRRENRLRIQARSLATTANVLPIESEYLEAIGYAPFDPELAASKLEALLVFYGNRTDLSGPTGKILELARRRLEGLRRFIARYEDPRRARIRERLDDADRLESSDPEAARRIRWSVVTLYGTKPWAAEEVARARQALEKQAAGEQQAGNNKSEQTAGEQQTASEQQSTGEQQTAGQTPNTPEVTPHDE